MVSEEVARDAQLPIRNLEAGAKETEEKHDHRRIGVHKLDGVPIPRAFSPVQHATRHVKRIFDSRSFLAALLRIAPAGEAERGSRGATVNGSRSKPGSLLAGELDVANPQTHGRLGDSKHSREAFDREPMLSPESANQLTFDCFHFRQQRI